MPYKISELSALFSPQSVIAITGAGGKTSMLFFLAHALPWNSFSATTVKVGRDEMKNTNVILSLDQISDAKSFLEEKLIWINSPNEPGEGKVIGMTLNELSQLIAPAKALHRTILYEADGAHHRHIKAPAAYEPVIADETTHTVQLVGLDTLYQPITSEIVHRVEHFTEITDTQQGDIITHDVLIRAMVHPRGGFQHTPLSASRIVVLNQADSPSRIQWAEQIAAQLIQQGVDSVWITKLYPQQEAKVIRVLTKEKFNEKSI